MTQEQMNLLVPQKLKEIERAYGVTVLWAVESGSRAWGFASPDSDFDVRFLYKRRPEAYLKLKPERDVIELPVDDTWDVNGWDLDKTLKLLGKSNPTLYEWMDSPIRYMESDFARRISPLMQACFSEERMLYHYLNTARRSIKTFLQGETVRPKKYFYALRPILACEWMRTYHTAPPMQFEALCREMLPDALRPSVERLLELKMNGPEKMTIPPIRDISDYLDAKCIEVDAYLQSVEEKDAPWAMLDAFFLEEIGRTE